MKKMVFLLVLGMFAVCCEHQENNDVADTSNYVPPDKLYGAWESEVDEDDDCPCNVANIIAFYPGGKTYSRELFGEGTFKTCKDTVYCEYEFDHLNLDYKITLNKKKNGEEVLVVHRQQKYCDNSGQPYWTDVEYHRTENIPTRVNHITQEMISGRWAQVPFLYICGETCMDTLRFTDDGVMKGKTPMDSNMYSFTDNILTFIRQTNDPHQFELWEYSLGGMDMIIRDWIYFPCNIDWSIKPIKLKKI